MSFIRLQLKSGEGKVTSNLSRVLGQYQINTAKFCTKFNAESNQKFKNGILLNIHVYKINKDLFNISFSSPSLKFIIFQFLKNYKKLNIEQIYDIYRLYNFLNLNLKINVKNFFGTLSTFYQSHNF